MATSLITGGAGGIGLHLARAILADGQDVILVDDFSRATVDPDLEELLSDPNVALIEGDISDAGTLRQLSGEVTYFYHLAAILGVESVLQDPSRVLKMNADLTIKALDSASNLKGLKRFLFASTSEVYAGTLEHGILALPTPEDSPIVLPPLERPRTSYMMSKLYGEALTRQSGLPIVIVRPHNVYGPRMGSAHVIPQMLVRAHATKDGGEFLVPSADHKRTFCYVEDAVAMFRLVMETNGCEGETFNVGTQSPEIAIGDLARRILRVVGVDLRIVPDAPAQGSPVRRAPEMTKMEQMTGFEPSVGIDEGLERTWAWYRDNGSA